MKRWKPQKKIARTATAIGKITFMDNTTNNTTPIQVKVINLIDPDRKQIVNAALEHLKKELQTIDDENDLSYDELNYIIKGFGFWTHSK